MNANINPLMTYVMIVSKSKVKATETRKIEEQAEVQQEIKERAKEHEEAAPEFCFAPHLSFTPRQPDHG